MKSILQKDLWSITSFLENKEYNFNKENNDYNYFAYEYFYNGGGVAVGDVNNDGLFEFYLGTGAFNYPAIVSKRVLQKNNGKDFQDVIIADRFGKLQKGNGVSFANFDNVGD